MMARSAYILQTQVISLGGRPFLPDRALRPIFRPMFTSKSCFTDIRLSILSPWRPTLWPAKPFIRNLGYICLDTENARLSSLGRCRQWGKLAELLGGREDYWDPYAKAQRLSKREYTDLEDLFGYDPALEDQRMNHLHFELYRPLFLKAVLGRQTQADGKVFIHLYPSGYVVIQLVIDLKQQNLQSMNSLRQAVRETRPSRSDGRWIWSTKLGVARLSEMVELIRKNIYQSLYADTPTSIKEGHWHSALKLVTTTKAVKVATNFLRGEYDLLVLGTFPDCDYCYHDDDEYLSPSGEYLLSSRQGLIFGLSPSRGRRSARRFFWKVFTLYEFVLLKNHIYDDYAEFLRHEIANLKEFRLSTLRKVTREDMRRFAVYDPRIPRYLLVLDTHSRSASPFYRRVYSSISRGTGFDERRDKVLKLAKEWEAEVEQWEHSLALLWKKVILPLRSLLRLG